MIEWKGIGLAVVSIDWTVGITWHVRLTQEDGLGIVYLNEIIGIGWLSWIKSSNYSIIDDFNSINLRLNELKAEETVLELIRIVTNCLLTE